MGILVTLILGTLSIPIVLAVLPALVLMLVIYRQDKIEKEPGGLLVRLFFLGALSTVFAGIMERMLTFLLDSTMIAANGDFHAPFHLSYILIFIVS